MTKRQPYWIYVAGVFVAWAVVLLISWRTLSPHKFHDVVIFCAGFLLGVTGASIARKVYK